jgi:hypothetical protein
MDRVEKAFEQHGIVPKLFPVAPKNFLKVVYGKKFEVS